jgi:transcriptional regulator with XRE-family HTH domain
LSRGNIIVAHKKGIMLYNCEVNLNLRRKSVPNKNLIAWIEDQLRDRNWRPADLARAAGVKDSTISRVLNGNAKAGPELCNNIAKALGVSPIEVFRAAELLPTSVGYLNELTEVEAELIKLYRQLSSSEDRSYALHFLRGFVEQMRK